MISVRYFCRFIAIFTALCFFSVQALAVTLIRDAEIEHTLRSFSTPVFRAAGVNNSAAKIFIVQDDSLNAYVAGGANVFINTGLIMATETPDVLLGVIAHETGHIAGGHLARGTEKLKNAELGTILTFVLGATAAAITKKPEATAAIVYGGQNAVTRDFLSYTRANEQAADQSAVNTLDKLGISSSGMLKMFEILKRNERQKIGAPDPYTITHPLTADRIDFVRNHARKSKITEGQYPKQYELMHQRMVAKLYGFIQTPEKTMQKYELSDKSIPARLARAVAYYKMPDLTRSLTEINSLIEEQPNDPFFHELKGQILFENGKNSEALESYKKAVDLLPNSALILADLGKVEIAQDTKSTLKSAITHLEKSVLLDNSNAASWRLLATAYGHADNIPMSNLALAEEALLTGNSKTAIQMASQAIATLPSSSPSHRRAQDIKSKAADIEKKKERDDSPF